MITYLIPADDGFVESIARTIARNRMDEFAIKEIESIPNLPAGALLSMEGPVDHIFEDSWASTDEDDVRQREGYRSDALAAIRAINLKLLTLSNEG
jgi:hypothetical protein